MALRLVFVRIHTLAIATICLSAQCVFMDELSSDFDLNTLCNIESLEVTGGTYEVAGTIVFEVQCDEGFVPPLGGMNHSSIYSCNVKSGKAVVFPRECVVKRLAYRKLKFLLWYNSTNDNDRLCEEKVKSQLLEERTSEILSATSGSTQKEIKIIDCTRPGPHGDLTLLTLVITKVEKRNISRKCLSCGYAGHVIIATHKLRQAMVEQGYIESDDSKLSPMSFNEENKGGVYGYHCDEHLELRKEKGKYVCVGCGQGYWLDMQTRECHRCGSGFYNHLQTATACFPCPVQFMYGPSASISIEDCFYSAYHSSMNVIMDVLVVPLGYLCILALVVFIMRKFSLIHIETEMESKIS